MKKNEYIAQTKHMQYNKALFFFKSIVSKDIDFNRKLHAPLLYFTKNLSKPFFGILKLFFVIFFDMKLILF